MHSFTPKLFSVLKNGYSFSDFKSDLIAGFTVSVVALPLAMALAIASGAAPEAGILTSIIAGFLISFLGGSRVQIGGPTGAFVVIIFGVITQFGYDGLLIATLLAGILLILAGFARLGDLMKYISQPVITGFTSGIAVIIASTQVKDFLGLKMEHVPSDFLEKWIAYFSSMHTAQITTIAVGFFAAIVIYAIRKISPKVPSYLVALVLTSLLVVALNLDVETIGTRFPEIKAEIPLPKLPVFSFSKLQLVFPSALTIAFLAGVEALLSAVVADGMTGFRHRPNQELIAQGIANFSSALFGGLPATGAIARTATNITSGAKTPFAGMFHSLFLLLFVLFAAGSMKFVPMGALAAILFFVAWRMSEAHEFVRILRFPGSDRYILLLTFFLTVFVDLTVAIGVGVTLASLLFLSQMSRSVEIGRGVEEEKDQRENLPEGVEVFWIAGPLFFGVSREIPELLKKIGEKPRVLIIRMRLVPFLDLSGTSALKDLVEQCNSQGIEVIFSGLQQQPKAILSRKNLKGLRFASTYSEALELAKS